MVEVIEVKHIPGISKGANVLVNSVEDLKKIAELFNVPCKFKDGKSHYIRIESQNAVFTYEG